MLKRLSGHPVFLWSLVISAILFIVPMLLYEYFILKSSLPSPDSWSGNHGPWRFAWPRNYLYWAWVALLVLVPGNIILGSFFAFTRKSVLYLMRGLLLSAVNFGLAYIHLLTILWTID